MASPYRKRVVNNMNKMDNRSCYLQQWTWNLPWEIWEQIYFQLFLLTHLKVSHDTLLWCCILMVRHPWFDFSQDLNYTTMKGKIPKRQNLITKWLVSSIIWELLLSVGILWPKFKWDLEIWKFKPMKLKTMGQIDGWSRLRSTEILRIVKKERQLFTIRTTYKYK